MDRRRFLQATAATALMRIPGSTQAVNRPRPNLLYVFDDQHRAAALPGEPYSPVIAPTLEAFRKSNFSMDKCISNYPLCTPYRGMFMTGRWPYQTGLFHNGADISADEISLGKTFREQGYHTAYVGKWHLGHGSRFIPAGPDRQGFDDWHVWERTDDHFSSFTYDPNTGHRVEPEGWVPIFMTDQAVEIIGQQKKTLSKPWMMVVSYNPPHPPYEAMKEDEQPYSAADFPIRPNVRYSMKGMPGAIAALNDESGLRNVMLGYYGAITGIDKQFSRLLKALDETGQAENTIVIFTSDHGEMMGSQGRMQKNCPFEESIRVPFLVRYPGVTKVHDKSEMLFAAIDIYPTVCGLAGIPPPKHCVGTDLSGVIRGEANVRSPQHVFLMNATGKEADEEPTRTGRKASAEAAPANTARSPAYVTLPVYRGIRTQTHTYAVADSGRWLLYDNVADPYQIKNLVKDPAQRGLMNELDKLISAWLVQAGDSFPLAEKVTRISDFPA